MKFLKKLKKLYRHHTSIVRSLSVFIAVIIVGIFLLYPELRQVIELIHQRLTIIEETNKLEKKYTILASYDQNTLTSYLETASMIIPYSPSPQLILYSVESIANSMGISVPKIAIETVGDISTESAKTTKEQYKTILFNFESSGSPITMQNFIAKIQSSIPQMEITTMNISHNSSSGNPIVTASFAVSSFYSSKPTISNDVFYPIEKISLEDAKILEELGVDRINYQFTNQVQEYSDQRNPFYFAQ
jgi:hypothetical protein